MLSIFDGLRDVTNLSVVVRLVLAFLCGTSIGLERSYKNRPAGFRTHMLVCVGAAVASLTGQYLYLVLYMPTDISRLGAQVVSGLGFIGGGTIIVTKKKTGKGLTTAAGLWACGVIGLAVGAGFFEGAILATVLVLFTETIVSKLGGRIQHAPEFQIIVHYHDKEVLDRMLRYFKDKKHSITNLQITGTNETDQSVYSAVISLRPGKNMRPDALLSQVQTMNGVLSIELL